jgi:3-hydroxyacyl-CoA dehydrogenase/enoyl-CoA hydratase/3-hydroxybutyryl-CoA epimerase
MMNALHYIPSDDNGIAFLEFDLPESKVNTLSESVMRELGDLLDGDLCSDKINMLAIVSRKPGIFIAGADIGELVKIHDEEEAFQKSRAGQQIFCRLAALPYPTTAVIDGACLGGGLELALACTYRVVTDSPKTKLGLPEVSLGILPGWGGTQRLPKTVGLAEALKMIFGGKPFSGSKAVRIGLADKLVPNEFSDEQVYAFMKSKAGGKKKHRFDWLSLWPVRKVVLNKASETAERKAKGHYPAIPAIINLIGETVGGKLEEGLEKEALAFARLAMTPESRNLIGLYHIDQRLKKERGTDTEVEVVRPERVAVLGAGVMGGGIAWLFSQHGKAVRMKDVSWEAVSRGFAEAGEYYRQLLKLRKIKPHEVSMNMHRISGALDYSGFKDADVAVEAVVENMAVKKTVLAEVEQAVSEKTIVCSNTSALSISEMAKELKYPQRFVGMHFFNPVNRMPLVEVVAGEQSSPEAVASIVQLARDLHKTPIVVKDSPGFLVNRILIPYLNEAGKLLEEGVDFERVDRLVENFGMPMGPFVLADETGIDVGYKVIQELEHAFAPRLQAVSVLQDFIDAGLLGKKAGGGFYLHNGKSRASNPAARKLAEIYPASREITDDEILERLILTMLNEAVMCLEEGVVGRADYLDMALVCGIGFPPFLGGLLRYADDRALADIERTLKRLEEQCGNRFTPAPLITQMEREGKTFYG